VAEYDILVATAVECLGHGGRTLQQLHADVQRVWPGAKVLPTNIDAAVAAAQAANLIHESAGVYRLSEIGLAEVDKSRQWAEDVYRRTANDLKDKAARGLRDVEEEEARLWVGVISFALLAGIAAATAAYRGDVNLSGDSLITPRAIDLGEISRTLDRSNVATEVRVFLEAMVLEAIDPSVPFGNELVSSITTGYLLQAFVARRDAIAARDAVGSIAGQLVVLDTPVLFQLLAPPSADSPIRTAVQAARQANVRVVALEHSHEELAQVLRRIERDHTVELAHATRNAKTLDLFRRMVSEPLIETYLTGYMLGDFKDWQAFKVHVETLGDRLAVDGVERLAHGNRPEDQADHLFARLSATLAGRQSGRGVEEMRRDANTMAFAWRIRREYHIGPVWPASWVLTTDTAMALAYRRTNKADPATLTISPSQWVSILSAFSTPADVEQLAKTGAVMLAQETMLRVAARYPASAVVEIAEALAGTSNETDIRVAQITLDELLRDMPDLGADPKALGLAVASKMLDQRSRRLEQVQATYMAKLNAERNELAESRRRDDAARGEDRLKMEALERRVERLVTDQSAAAEAAERAAIKGRRRLIQVVAALIIASGVVISALVWQLTDSADALFGSLSLALAISVVAFIATSEAWVDDPRVGPKRLLLALLPQILAVPGLLQSFGVKLPWR